MEEERVRALEARLSALEGGNRRLKRGMAALAGVLLVGLAAGAQVVNDRLDIREQLIIRDRNDLVRFNLNVDRNNGKANGLILYDANGTRRIVLSVDDNGRASLGFYDLNGNRLAVYP